eukprot:7148257-Karenia_brevis.AAC.1
MGKGLLSILLRTTWVSSPASGREPFAYLGSFSMLREQGIPLTCEDGFRQPAHQSCDWHEVAMDIQPWLTRLSNLTCSSHFDSIFGP